MTTACSLLSDVLRTLLQTFITCWLDNCNLLLLGLPACDVSHLQSVQNAVNHLKNDWSEHRSLRYTTSKWKEEWGRTSWCLWTSNLILSVYLRWLWYAVVYRSAQFSKVARWIAMYTVLNVCTQYEINALSDSQPVMLILDFAQKICVKFWNYEHQSCCWVQDPCSCTPTWWRSSNKYHLLIILLLLLLLLLLSFL